MVWFDDSKVLGLDLPSLSGIMDNAVSVKQCSKVPGVYFLISNSEIVYVGSSDDTRSRIQVHLTCDKKIFDSYSIIACNFSDRRELFTVESYYIMLFEPRYNTNHPGSLDLISRKAARKDFDLEPNEFKQILKSGWVKAIAEYQGLVYYRRSDIEKALEEMDGAA